MSNYPAYIERMVDEKTQLDIKKQALSDFIQGDVYKGLLFEQRELLCDQIAAMRKYSLALGKRIDMEKNLHDAK